LMRRARRIGQGKEIRNGRGRRDSARSRRASDDMAMLVSTGIYVPQSLLFRISLHPRRQSAKECRIDYHAFAGGKSDHVAGAFRSRTP
jgi:hypothetical protein